MYEARALLLSTSENGQLRRRRRRGRSGAPPQTDRIALLLLFFPGLCRKLPTPLAHRSCSEMGRSSAANQPERNRIDTALTGRFGWPVWLSALRLLPCCAMGGSQRYV